MGYKMKGFGGFKNSESDKKTSNYQKGFDNMTNKELEGVVKRHKDRGTTRDNAFDSIKEAEISRDSLNTAQNTLRIRKLNKMDPSGRIRNSGMWPGKGSPIEYNESLIEKARKMGKKGRDKLKKIFMDHTPAGVTAKKFMKAHETYKKVNLGQGTKVKDSEWTTSFVKDTNVKSKKKKKASKKKGSKNWTTKFTK